MPAVASDAAGLSQKGCQIVISRSEGGRSCGVLALTVMSALASFAHFIFSPSVWFLPSYSSCLCLRVWRAQCTGNATQVTRRREMSDDVGWRQSGDGEGARQEMAPSSVSTALPYS